MSSRRLVSLAVLATAALALAGCPDENEASGTGGHHKKKHEASKEAEGADKGTAKKAAGGAAVYGTATIKGVVAFTGTAPEMKVPAGRGKAEFCKDTQIKYNAVIVTDGKLKDVLVRIAPGEAKGNWPPPEKHALIDQSGCMYEPRIQGMVAGQTIDIKNADGTMHNVHTFRGTSSWFNQAQPKGSPQMPKEMEDPNIVKFVCDVHPWMHGFVVVNDNPFFAVSAADGSFTIEKVPAGKYKLEAWHATYGMKTAEVTVADKATVETKFSYDGTEKEPAENQGELKDLF